MHSYGVKNRSAEFNELHQKFQAEFKGTAIDEFRDAFQGQYVNYSTEEHYGRIISIVNSSGLGKSKLVYELGKEVSDVSVRARKNTLI